MSAEVTDLNAVTAALSDACVSSCTTAKRQAMMALDHYQMCDGYIESLVRIIDVNDVGANMALECRHLAAVLLKNVISKRGASLDKQSKACAGMRPLLTSEKNALKSFLARYMYEPQCKVALQLSLSVAKLARLEGDSWVKEWPELITSIITILQSSIQIPPNSPGNVQPARPVIPVDGASYGCTIRAICTLQELLSELSGKAASGCSSAVFTQGYSALCTQLYCIISKSWAGNMKKLQPILHALNQHAIKHYNNAHFLSAALPEVVQITGYTTREIESLFAHTVLLSKVVRIVVEYGFEQIGSTYPTFYTNFWKTYLGSVKLLADFVRAHRPMCVEIMKQRTNTSNNNNNNVTKRTSEHLVYMKHILMTEDDADDPCDAYFALGNEQATLSDTISILNLSLKLIKSLVCAPVVLQMKYPTLVLPSLEGMVAFAYTMLSEEFPHAMQEYELSAQGPCNSVNPSTSTFIQVLTFDQAHTLYTQETLRNALPLSYLAKACSMLLSNVLKCCAYCEYNVYTPSTTSIPIPNNSNLSTSHNSMDECPQKSNSSLGYDLKTAFFTTDRVATLVRMLLYPLLTYTKKELNEWTLNPEEFIISQQDHEPCYSVKTAGECLFFNLVEYAPDVVCNILAPLLMDCVRQEAIYSPNNIHTNSNNEILAVYKCSVVSRYVHNRELCIWDAVYMCTGLGIAHLSSYFCKLKERYSNAAADLPCSKCPSFSTETATSPSKVNNKSECGENGGASYWVQHYLGPMVTQLLKNPYSGCLEHKQQLLRSRLIWLLGIWMHKFEQSVLPHVLTILIDIISPGDSDIVVRMYAVEALHKLINLNVFDVTTLVFYVVKAVEALCLMVRTLEESDNKIAVLHLSGELIQLLSIQLTSLRPLVVPLAGYLENLWVETGHTDPTRSTILEVMTQLVRASKQYSATILPVTTPLIMFALSTSSTNSTSAATTIGNSVHMSDCGGDSYASAHNKNTSNYGYLVKDGLALWLAVMQNLTEAQYSAYHKELQHVFSVCMTSLHIVNTPTPAAYTTDAFVYNNWDILGDAESSVLITDILLCVEAYCLLGGEGCSILSDLNCRNALTALYMKCLGKVDVNLVQYVVRPLQALVLSCPSLAGAYLNECGLLAHIVRIIMASAPCVNLQNLVTSYKTTDQALVSYLTLIAYILYVDPSTLFAALTVFVAEVVSYVAQCTGTKCDKVLTEAILLQQIVGVMASVHSTIKSHNAPLYTYKLWSLALLTLIPPTLINNAPLLSPVGESNTSNTTSSSKGLATKPDCIFGRIMLKLLSTVQCTFGKECLEQYQRDYCNSHGTTSSSDSTSLDYSTLSFWYPSTLSTEQLYGMVDSIVTMSKCTLKHERRKGHNDALLRQLDELIQGGSGEGLAMETSNMGAMNEMFLNCESSDSSDSGDNDDDNDTDSEDTECMNCTSGKNSPTDDTIELNVNMTAGITAAEGDAQLLDVCELPLRTVLRSRLAESYILNAKVEVHLKEKCTQLRRVLGEEHYATLRCVGELGL